MGGGIQSGGCPKAGLERMLWLGERSVLERVSLKPGWLFYRDREGEGTEGMNRDKMEGSAEGDSEEKITGAW